jgi:hypothetical protein
MLFRLALVCCVLSTLPASTRRPLTSPLGSVEKLLGSIAFLEQTGVVYDEHDPDGHIPVRRFDGRYHMACIDLLTVCYRTAGYDFGPVIFHRRVALLKERIRYDDRFRFFVGPGTNPRVHAWRPPAPFRVGDMLFVRYDDAPEYHAGIVTGVDPRTGLPAYVTHISGYTPTGGIYRSTYREFFRLRCRQLVGWARPVAWDRAPPGAVEKTLTVIPRADGPCLPAQLFGVTRTHAGHFLPD